MEKTDGPGEEFYQFARTIHRCVTAPIMRLPGKLGQALPQLFGLGALLTAERQLAG